MGKYNKALIALGLTAATAIVSAVQGFDFSDFPGWVPLVATGVTTVLIYFIRNAQGEPPKPPQ